MQQPTEVCKLEDVLVRVSNAIYKELGSLLSQFRQEDKEQRTREFKKFVLSSRRCIYQVLALTNWLRKNDTKNFFKAIAHQSEQLARYTGLIAFHVDRFFYLNIELFFMFNREHEVEVAFELQSRQTFQFFSSRVLTSKTPLLDLEKVTKPKLPNDMQSGDIRSYMTLESYRELSLDKKRVFASAIRGKLALYDKLPQASPSLQNGFLPPIQACIDDGLLKIRCSEYFVAYISLQDAKSSAAWNIVYFHIFRPQEPQRSVCDIDKEERMTSFEMETIQSINISNEYSKPYTLKDLLSRMTQVVMKERIRILTKAFVRFSKNSLFAGELSMPRYFDTPQGVEMREYFWNNEISKQMSYMMRVVLTPFQEEKGVDIAVELYGYDPNKIDSTMNERLSGSDQVYRLICRSTEADTVLFYLSLKTTPMEIMTKTCLPLIQLKFSFLERRIKQSQMLPDASVEIHPFSLIVVFPHDVVVSFIIDRTSGKSIVSADGLGEFEEMCQIYLQKIAEDLNSVQRESILLPLLLNVSGESKSMEQFLTAAISSYEENVTIQVNPLAPFESFLKKLDLVLFFMPFIDHPLVSMSELRELATILRKPAKNSIAFALQCWDVADHQTIEMQHLRKEQRTWLEEQAHMTNQQQNQVKKQKTSTANGASYHHPSKLKVLYLYIYQKDQAAPSRDLTLEVSSIICSLTVNAMGKKTLMSEHWCTDILSLQRSINLSTESIRKYVDRVLPWARKQFEHSLLVRASFSQLLLNQPINKARFGHKFVQDRFAVIVEESEGIWVDVDDEEFLSIHFYTSGTKQCLEWGIDKRNSTCPANVLKAFKDKGLENPVLFSSMKLRLLTELRSKVKQKDEIVPYFVIKLEEFSINLRESSGDEGNNVHDQFASSTIGSMSLKCIEDILRRIKLPLEFEWLTLYPIFTSIRTAMTLVWTTAYYACKGYVGFDSDRFLKPISIDRNTSKLTILFGLCIFDSEEQADEARKNLLLDISRYCNACIPCSTKFGENEDDDEEDEKENAEESKTVSFRFADVDSSAPSIEVSCEKITFETSFETLSDLYQRFG